MAMLVAVSPYHLTTREPAAAAALLLADRVVTLLPAPFSGLRQAAEEAAHCIPKYLDFVMSWQWSVPLWEAGVIRAQVNGDAGPAADVRAAFEEIAADERYACLRSLMKPEVFEADDAYLEAVARDLLKGGPDPGITVPVAAGLDRFAIRHGAAVARSAPASVVQKAEEMLGDRLFTVVVPILLQASAERLLEARELLEPELEGLREAIDARFASGLSAGGGRPSAGLTEAAAAYIRAFERLRGDLLSPVEDDDARIIEAAAAITAMSLPADAVLTSSVSALRTLSPALTRVAGRPSPLQANVSGRPQIPVSTPKALASPRVLTLMVRVLGRPAAAGR